MFKKEQQLNFRPPSAIFREIANIQVKAPDTLRERNLKIQLYFYPPSDTRMRHSRKESFSKKLFKPDKF